jgi:cytochrome c
MEAAMKRALLISALSLLSGACVAADMPASATELGCATCHAIDRAGTGPSWMEVSLRYRAEKSDPAVVDQLVAKISRGGAGKWGSTPMVASDPVGRHQDKIRQLVQFILALSDRAPAAQQAALGNGR